MDINSGVFEFTPVKFNDEEQPIEGPTVIVTSMDLVVRAIQNMEECGMEFPQVIYYNRGRCVDVSQLVLDAMPVLNYITTPDDDDECIF